MRIFRHTTRKQAKKLRRDAGDGRGGGRKSEWRQESRGRRAWHFTSGALPVVVRASEVTGPATETLNIAMLHNPRHRDVVVHDCGIGFPSRPNF